jgi:hypothetical protein
MLFANTNDATASEVEVRNRAEASAASRLVDNGHLVRLWKPPAAPGETKALGLYRADSEAQLAGSRDRHRRVQPIRHTRRRSRPDRRPHRCRCRDDSGHFRRVGSSFARARAPSDR